jgi:hypothetical protein
MSKLKQYLSTRVSKEDFDENGEALEPALVEQNEILDEQEVEVPEVDSEVTPEIIDEAEVVADDAQAEIEDLPADVEEVTELEGEVGEEIASIEEFCGILAHGRRTKTYSPQFAAAVQGKLNRLNEMFEVEDKKRVSLENYGGEDLSEFYRVSQEAFEGFAKRLSDTLHNAATALAGKLKAKWGVGVYEKVDAKLQARADAILSGTGKAEPAVIKGKTAAVHFHIGGEFNGDILGNLTKDMRFASGRGQQLVKGTAAYLQNVIKILDKGVVEGGKGKTGEILAEVLKLKRPVDILAEEDFKGAMSGGMKFVKVAEKGKEGDTRGAYKDIARSSIPTIDGDRFKGEAADVTIDKATADKIAKTAKAFSALTLKIAQGSALNSIEETYTQIGNVSKRVKTAANATSWTENKDLNIVAAGLAGMTERQFMLLWTLIHTCFDTIEFALYFAEKAVEGGSKKEEPAAAE